MFVKIQHNPAQTLPTWRASVVPDTSPDATFQVRKAGTRSFSSMGPGAESLPLIYNVSKAFLIPT